jgi:hypothetical protein
VPSETPHRERPGEKKRRKKKEAGKQYRSFLIDSVKRVDWEKVSTRAWD